ncbi:MULTISPECIES: helix-turn-helix transcriptional regulator [Pseudoalteromonas]|uniref:XRE family transcriptional regulator n=2 Tax=Pseudoalteromonas TaxID=53246 RepID=A0AAD0W521_PSEO7|nr:MULTISPECIES: helix-turn-helix transcriptional regulator [Pseudoalteromonas]ASD66154.1 transcriptional regulator [Pseudoalteromonas piscicida]AUJ70982.1 Helix-turn-helix domain protein [Pseudoalteromonas sp. NC201]AXQ97078.1 XRE family transcriptional regulator [Pseudoalteromonas piscicida]AXR03141.1 XRE family transcriptional regulator [Pseudoalteromonas piscicida]KID36683.1 XRE family transcriptional regulator [Pseudoalteromonas flavipulchra NCIMB 2033 = ATCC BAA-314]
MMGKTVSSEENGKLTKWLKSKRHEKGHTMRSLAQVLGTPHSFIGKIENQERRLDVIEFLRYCEALEVDPYEGLQLIKEDQ